MPEEVEGPGAKIVAVEAGERQNCSCRWVGPEKEVEDYEMVFRDGCVQDFGKYQEVVEDMVHQKE